MHDTTIAILPIHLANQIAAGEVVQRPASVVKELLENALDAGATSITVIVQQAGSKLIHVMDNGKGMHRSDVELSIVRHATSKIATEDDLHAIRTLGFRGEALASIAAVAEVEIRSRRAVDDVGTVLISHPGREVVVRHQALEVGTQVVVRQLFASVPARRKFLKSDATELRHIIDAVQRAALARPDVRWLLKSESSTILDVAPADLPQRSAAVLSIERSEVSSSLHEVSFSRSGIVVEGLVGAPSLARTTRSSQYLFLHGRPIVSRSLSHAIASAYEALLPNGMHPLYVLHVSIDPQRVDVNVHPQKHEVKFDNEQQVYQVVEQSVRAALQQSAVVPRMPHLQQIHPAASRSISSLPALPTAARTPSTSRDPVSPMVVREQVDLLFGRTQPEPARVFAIGSDLVGSVVQDGVMIVHVRRAHERVLYERMTDRESANTGSQALMFPVPVQLSATERQQLEELRDALEQMGYRFSLETTPLSLTAVPQGIPGGAEQESLKALLEEVDNLGGSLGDQQLERLAALAASQQAVRSNQPRSTAVLQQIVDDLFTCSVPQVTPGGEPTYTLLTFDELYQRL
jgi:DNA mismatch repair protein MutL